MTRKTYCGNLLWQSSLTLLPPDFVLVQVGWMVSGLHFATSRRLCAERGHLAFRRRFLHTLTDAASVDGLCDLAEKELERDATL